MTSDQSAIALVDARCFFVSAERMVEPRLEHRPVVVLSNNDGCVVSRADEAKALGITMGQPWFQIEPRTDLASVIPRSSNYELYGDLSSRFTQTISSVAANVEVYSIDENFVELPVALAGEMVNEIQARILQWVKLPTAAGIGSTKTLAKVAQHHAKDTGEALCDVTSWSSQELRDLLASTPISDVWGVGRQLTVKLNDLGIWSALDLANADPLLLRRRFSVVLERTARELAGERCMEVGMEPKERQQIIYSRMFGRPITTRSEMASALGQYAQRAARRLRAQKLQAALMQVSLSTSRFQSRSFSHTHSVVLDPPTDNSLDLVNAAQCILPQLLPGKPYNRACILLTGLSRVNAQPVLWGEADPQTGQLITALDELKARFGRQSVGIGYEGLRKPAEWEMRRAHLSPAATTRFDQLLRVGSAGAGI